MIDLEAIQVRRAAEQLRCLDFSGEGGRRDSWAIRPSQYVGRKRAATRRHCLACDQRATHHGYCHSHYKKILKGVALDRDVWGITARAASERGR